MDVVQIFLIFGVTGTSLLIAVAYLIKTLTSHLLNKDVERFKIDLIKESDREKFQYSILQERRSVIIEKFYKMLVNFEEASRSLMAPFQPSGVPPENERAATAFKKFTEFRNFYLQYRIYFDEATCKTIDRILEVFRSAWVDFEFKEKLSKPENDLWVKAWKVISEEIPSLRKELEAVFRKIIGIN